MSNTSKGAAATKPSGNWMTLQKQKLKSTPTSASFGLKGGTRVSRSRPVTPSKASPGPRVQPQKAAEGTSFPRGPEEPVASTSAVKLDEIRNGESLETLRGMIQGNQSAEATKRGAKKYIAIDCEMVGVGIEGSESSLARVSVVNYYGVVELDELVQQKERVFDYRTKWSGIRPKDMVRARPFEEVQKKVASLIEGKILVGHAVHNDLKALLLSHPHFLIRDTQVLAGKHGVMKSRTPALRHLVEQEIGISIQTGEHSSVTDARATMAIFRLHRKTWESGLPKAYFVASHPAAKKTAQKTAPQTKPSAPSSLKRKAPSPPTDDEKPAAKVQKTHSNESMQQKVRSRASAKPQQQQNPGGGRKGVSSGLSTIVRKVKATGWWKDLSGS